LRETDSRKPFRRVGRQVGFGPMPPDPFDPGVMPSARIGMTKSQVRQLAERVQAYLESGKPLDSVRLEEIPEAYLRLVFIGPEGGPVDEIHLFPR
jgi:hypothetical protein